MPLNRTEALRLLASIRKHSSDCRKVLLSGHLWQAECIADDLVAIASLLRSDIAESRSDETVVQLAVSPRPTSGYPSCP